MKSGRRSFIKKMLNLDSLMVLIRQLFSTFVTQNISAEQENQCKNIRFKFRFLLTHHSTMPLFHHSNWGEAPDFSCN